MNTRAITAAALAAGLLFQAQGFTQDTVLNGTSTAPAPAAADPEAAAREIWRSFVVKNPAPEQGCFRSSYPNFVWERTDCKDTPTRVHPPAGAGAGAHYDYVAQSTGLISFAQGGFITNGVESVTSVGGNSNEGGSPILGSGEYSLQLNTNSNGNSAACGKQAACTVWQQFMYATDYNGKGEAALLMQYWLQHWTGPCPTSWTTQRTGNDTGTETSCYKNNSVSLPDIPITELGRVTFIAYATPGGNDTLILTDCNAEESCGAWSVTGDDSVLDIGSVWQQAEFNVLGDMEYAEAQFNPGSSITEQLYLIDGSSAAPTCVPPSAQNGTTGETNNLNLGTCQTGVFINPYIEFTESAPPAPPPPGISHCPGGITSSCKGISLD